MSNLRDIENNDNDKNNCSSSQRSQQQQQRSTFYGSLPLTTATTTCRNDEEKKEATEEGQQQRSLWNEQEKQPSSSQSKTTDTASSSDQNSLGICFMYGVINATIVLPVLMSFGNIIYSNDFFQPYLPTLIKLTLVSGFVHQLSFTTISSLPFVVGQVQDAGLIFLSSMANQIVDNCHAETDEVILATTTIGLSIATLILGCSLVVIGKCQLAQYVQMLPMCVIGGYLAYIGWFCGISGIGIMANTSNMTLSIFVAKLHFILPGIVGGIFIYSSVRMLKHIIVLPCCIICLMVIFYVILYTTDTSLQQATEQGWILQQQQAEEDQAFFTTWAYFNFNKVAWSALPRLILTEIGMIFVVALSSSLDVAAIELELIQQQQQQSEQHSEQVTTEQVTEQRNNPDDAFEEQQSLITGTAAARSCSSSSITIPASSSSTSLTALLDQQQQQQQRENEMSDNNNIHLDNNDNTTTKIAILNYNHELITVGCSNILSGMTGGYTGSYIFSQSIFNLRAGIRHRSSGYFLALLQILIFVSPMDILQYVPNFFFGSLLTLIAIDLMLEWLFYVKAKVSNGEYIICWLTFLSIHILGVEYGIIFGVVIYYISYHRHKIWGFLCKNTSSSKEEGKPIMRKEQKQNDNNKNCQYTDQTNRSNDSSNATTASYNAGYEQQQRQHQEQKEDGERENFLKNGHFHHGRYYERGVTNSFRNIRELYNNGITFVDESPNDNNNNDNPRIMERRSKSENYHDNGFPVFAAPASPSQRNIIDLALKYKQQLNGE